MLRQYRNKKAKIFSVAAISVFSLKLLVYLAVLVFTNWSLFYAIGAQSLFCLQFID